MAILVSGGAGYIGSHTCIELLNAGYDVVVADNYYNASPVVLDRIKQITGKDFRFYKADMTKHEDVEHIFSELYAVPAGIRRGYFKVKVLELLLFLSALDVAHEKHGYTAAQVRLARAARDALLASTEDDVTISALAQELGASPSQLAASFRGVYGMTPAAFLRAQKMHSAAQLLRTSDRTVLDIAGQFGYDNASKFAKAFRSVIGVSPSAYRAGADSDSCAPTAEKAE